MIPSGSLHGCCKTSFFDNFGKTLAAKNDILMYAIEKISLVALSIFSAYANFSLFLPFFAAGCAIGILNYRKDSCCQHVKQIPSCSQGLLEQLTGVKLPAPISLATNLGIFICHLQHHAQVFVPIVGLFGGAWIGSNLSHARAVYLKKCNSGFSQDIPR